MLTIEVHSSTMSVLWRYTLSHVNVLTYLRSAEVGICAKLCRENVPAVLRASVFTGRVSRGIGPTDALVSGRSFSTRRVQLPYKFLNASAGECSSSVASLLLRLRPSLDICVLLRRNHWRVRARSSAPDHSRLAKCEVENRLLPATPPVMDFVSLRQPARSFLPSRVRPLGDRRGEKPSPPSLLAKSRRPRHSQGHRTPGRGLAFDSCTIRTQLWRLRLADDDGPTHSRPLIKTGMLKLSRSPAAGRRPGHAIVLSCIKVGRRS
jgi:hypothetical protein